MCRLMLYDVDYNGRTWTPYVSNYFYYRMLYDAVRNLLAIATFLVNHYFSNIDHVIIR